ncbi:cytochrome b/b6 domain-containing protein [Dechloromonas sp. HYN0024]|uniref:cytochrome b/b6 domain-containing protein n=1 Tax=Dechloromonas sp. HYN0024 TaxID=2231055 RepID=UPI000E42DA43|nr:cytochrome b/b6 domain-containing protein [Dechloromonas sp. HYN0024]AXS80648.1 cytochrome B [Dechloromonas sp. HYN0024]
MKKVLVWDLPTRLFHWLLVAAIAGAYFTGENGGNWLVWHERLGILIVGLIAFRLAWGFAGSTYARFATFVRGPVAIKSYLAGQWQGLGHNPLGALSVLGLLTLVALQFSTGLFAQNDDTGFAGPFYALVSDQLGGLATSLHHKIFDVLMILIGLHVAAIVYYVRVKKDNLVKPMITGHKEVSHGDSARGGSLPALIFALLVGLAASYGASGAWVEKPPAPPAAATPAW